MTNKGAVEEMVDSGQALAIAIAILATVAGAAIWFLTVSVLNSNPVLLGGAVAMTFAGPTAIVLAKNMKPGIDADLSFETTAKEEEQPVSSKYRDGPHEGISSATWL